MNHKNIPKKSSKIFKKYGTLLVGLLLKKFDLLAQLTGLALQVLQLALVDLLHADELMSKFVKDFVESLIALQPEKTELDYL